MTIAKNIALSALFAATLSFAGEAQAGCTVNGNALACDSQTSALGTLLGIAAALVVPQSTIDTLVDKAKGFYVDDYKTNIGNAKQAGWLAAQETNPSGTTSMSETSYNSAYGDYLEARQGIRTSSSTTLASYLITYTAGVLKDFTLAGPLSATISFGLSMATNTVSGEFSYNLTKTVQLPSASILISPEVDYGEGVTDSAVWRTLTGWSDRLAAGGGDGTAETGYFGGDVYGYPKSGFKAEIRAAPGPLAGIGLPALLIGLAALGLRQRRFAA